MFLSLETTPFVDSAATPQILNQEMKRVSNVTTFFNEGIYNGAVIDFVNQKGYFGTFTNPGLIVRIDLPTMSREARLSIPIGFGNFKSGLEICGMAYFPCSTSPRGGFVVVNLNRFELVAAVQGERGEFNFVAPVSYLDFIVFGTQSTPAYLIEYNLASIERTSRNLTLPTSNVRASISKGATAYFVLGPIGGSICKVDISLMQVLEYYYNSSLSDFTAVAAAFDATFGSKFLFETTTKLVRYVEPVSSSEVTEAKIAAENYTSYPRAFLYIGIGKTGGGFLKFEVTENVTFRRSRLRLFPSDFFHWRFVPSQRFEFQLPCLY
jgi:hypothetical protein